MQSLIVALLLGAQGIPPIQQFDAGPLIRQMQENRRLQIDQQNADTYARQTEIYGDSQKDEPHISTEERAQNIAVGNAIAEGQCAVARRMALEWGRFDLVDRVRTLCEQAPQP